jgi:outer membrane protein assembly factor BamB
VAALIACCRDVLVVVSWLAAWVSSGGATGPSLVNEPPARVIWHVQGEGRGTPAVHGSTAFFLSKHHQLIAIDYDSGRVRWRRSTGGPGPTTAGTSVIVTPSRVIAGDGAVIGFTHDGREVWRFDSGATAHAGAYLGGTTAGIVSTGSAAGRMFALHAESGDVRWSIDVAGNSSVTVFAPVVDGDRVFAAYTQADDLRHGGIVSVDVATGRVVWRRTLPRAPDGTRRGVGGGPLPTSQFVLCAGDDGTIYALERSTGALRWSLASSPVGSRGTFEFRPLALAGDLLIAGSLAGSVTAYDLATRRERWRRAPMNASIVFGIATDGRTVYVPYLSGRLIALDAEDGLERWRTSADAYGFSWKPLIAAGRVLATSSSAGFFAFGL